jgi:hypothetical protein
MTSKVRFIIPEHKPFSAAVCENGFLLRYKTLLPTMKQLKKLFARDLDDKRWEAIGS